MSSASTEKNRLRNILSESDFLVHPSDDLLDAVVSNTSSISPEQGELVFETDDPAERFFVVINGRVELIQEFSDGKKTRCRMKQGELFGLLSTATSSSRRASARVESDDTSVACICYEDLVDELEEKDILRPFMEGLLKHLKKRIDRTSDVIETLV